ncbi:hypothetical protein C8Q75DRAFT_131053 [Abortiporus biennis]|nr:hypothetical protein C8Q75DRAFT_131053 [Abortiporus biennis]
MLLAAMMISNTMPMVLTIFYRYHFLYDVRYSVRRPSRYWNHQACQAWRWPLPDHVDSDRNPIPSYADTTTTLKGSDNFDDRDPNSVQPGRRPTQRVPTVKPLERSDSWIERAAALLQSLQFDDMMVDEDEDDDDEDFNAWYTSVPPFSSTSTEQKTGGQEETSQEDEHDDEPVTPKQQTRDIDPIASGIGCEENLKTRSHNHTSTPKSTTEQSLVDEIINILLDLCSSTLPFIPRPLIWIGSNVLFLGTVILFVTCLLPESSLTSISSLTWSSTSNHSFFSFVPSSLWISGSDTTIPQIDKILQLDGTFGQAQMLHQSRASLTSSHSFSKTLLSDKWFLLKLHSREAERLGGELIQSLKTSNSCTSEKELVAIEKLEEIRLISRVAESELFQCNELFKGFVKNCITLNEWTSSTLLDLTQDQGPILPWWIPSSFFPTFPHSLQRRTNFVEAFTDLLSTTISFRLERTLLHGNYSLHDLSRLEMHIDIYSQIIQESTVAGKEENLPDIPSSLQHPGHGHKLHLYDNDKRVVFLRTVTSHRKEAADYVEMLVQVAKEMYQAFEELNEKIATLCNVQGGGATFTTSNVQDVLGVISALQEKLDMRWEYN